MNVIEIFGRKLTIVEDNAFACNECALADVCLSELMICKDAAGNVNRRFEEVKEEQCKAQKEKDNPEKKLFAKKGEWFKCIQVPKTHMQYKFNKYVQYCSNEDNCICDNSGENVYIPTYIKDFESHFVKITLTK